MTVRGRVQALRRVLPCPRATPFTFCLLAVLAASTAALRWTASDHRALLRWASTNLVNLSHHPVSALVASAFVSPGSIWLDVVVLAVAGAVLERGTTTARTALVLIAGHVVASLLTEGAVRIAIAVHTDPSAAARQLDVGISYVMYTAVGAALRFLPARWRRFGVVLAIAYVGSALLREPGMTTSGHLLSLGIGLVSWPLLVPRADRTARQAVIAQTPGSASTRLRITAVAVLAGLGVLTACAPGHYLVGGRGHNAQCDTTVRCFPGTAQPGN